MPIKSENTDYTVSWEDLVEQIDLQTGTTGYSRSPGRYTVSKSLYSVSGPTPNWKKRLAEEPVVTGNLYTVVTSHNRGVSRAHFSFTTRHVGPNGRYIRTQSGVRAPNPGIPAHDLSLIDRAKNGAIAELLKKYHKQTRSVQGLVSLGEIRETIRLIKRPADAIRGLYNNYWSRIERLHRKAQRGRKRYHGPSAEKFYKNFVDQLADEYLGFMFGISPLVGDIENATKYYNRINKRKHGKIAITGKANRETVTSGPFTNAWQTIVNYRLLSTRESRSKVDVKYRAGFRASVGPGPYGSNAVKAAVDAGFDKRDVIPAIWELLPCSFLSDYFSNIGEIIDGWSFGDFATHGLQETVVKNAVARETGFRWEFPPGQTAYVPISASVNADALYERTNKTIERTRLPGLPVPTLEFSIPGLAFTSTKWWNMAALVQARGRRAKAMQSENFWGQGVSI